LRPANNSTCVAITGGEAMGGVSSARCGGGSLPDCLVQRGHVAFLWPLQKGLGPDHSLERRRIKGGGRTPLGAEGGVARACLLQDRHVLGVCRVKLGKSRRPHIHVGVRAMGTSLDRFPSRSVRLRVDFLPCPRRANKQQRSNDAGAHCSPALMRFTIVNVSSTWKASCTRAIHVTTLTLTLTLTHLGNFPLQSFLQERLGLGDIPFG
jgi:hypothetical protein